MNQASAHCEKPCLGVSSPLWQNLRLILAGRGSISPLQMKTENLPLKGVCERERNSATTRAHLMYHVNLEM